jgi:hypothetical protein
VVPLVKISTSGAAGPTATGGAPRPAASAVIISASGTSPGRLAPLTMRQGGSAGMPPTGSS